MKSHEPAPPTDQRERGDAAEQLSGDWRSHLIDFDGPSFLEHHRVGVARPLLASARWAVEFRSGRIERRRDALEIVLPSISFHPRDRTRRNPHGLDLRPGRGIRWRPTKYRAGRWWLPTRRAEPIGPSRRSRAAQTALDQEEGQMPEVTLTVPEQFAEDFRAAIVREIAFDVRSIEDDQKARGEQLTGSAFAKKLNAADVRLHLEQLTADMAIAAQARLTEEGCVEVTSPEAGMLAHVCENMAQEVVGPQIAAALEVGPLDEGVANTLRPMVASLMWAVDNAERLYGECYAQKAVR